MSNRYVDYIVGPDGNVKEKPGNLKNRYIKTTQGRRRSARWELLEVTKTVNDFGLDALLLSIIENHAQDPRTMRRLALDFVISKLPEYERKLVLAEIKEVKENEQCT